MNKKGVNPLKPKREREGRIAEKSKQRGKIWERNERDFISGHFIAWFLSNARSSFR
jgi:hypothetical protein